MLENRFIICLGKDWRESPTSNNHVISNLAKKNAVVWFNSTGMRTPSATAGDIKKIFRKIKENACGPRKVSDNLRIFTPLVLPFPKYRFIRKLNSFILGRIIKGIIRKNKIKDIDIWLFYPTAFELVAGIKRSLLVYYCTDDWSKFSYLNSSLMRRTEENLLKSADIVFATSNILYEAKKKVNLNTFYMPHGVDFKHFSDTKLRKSTEPEDLKSISHPIIGFYGLIQDWIDFELLREIAKSHSEWSIVMIGKVDTDTSRIKDLPNVYLLGEKHYNSLPFYNCYFDVAIIPYNMADERMQSVNPTKLKQYLASGLPVVTVDLPEARIYREVVSIARNSDEFIENIEKCLKNNNAELISRRKMSVRNETWENKVEQISEIVLNTLQEKSRLGVTLDK